MMRQLLFVLASALLALTIFCQPALCGEEPCLKFELENTVARISWAGIDVVSVIRDRAPTHLQLIVVNAGAVLLPARSSGTIRVEDMPPGDYLFLIRAISVDEDIIPQVAYCGPLQAECFAQVPKPDVVTGLPLLTASAL